MRWVQITDPDAPLCINDVILDRHAQESAAEIYERFEATGEQDLGDGWVFLPRRRTKLTKQAAYLYPGETLWRAAKWVKQPKGTIIEKGDVVVTVSGERSDLAELIYRKHELTGKSHMGGYVVPLHAIGKPLERVYHLYRCNGLPSSVRTPSPGNVRFAEPLPLP